MSTTTIQRQYNEVIAKSYDRDPQSLNSDTLELALQQLTEVGALDSQLGLAKVLDVGMGTGHFFDKLREQSDRHFQLFGIDVSERMLELARRRFPKLQATVDDAANLDVHFDANSFDVVGTHFITGFVPLEVLAPKICRKLKPGGYWSFTGATSRAYPELQRKASSRVLQTLLGNRRLEMTELITPRDCAEVVQTVQASGFEVSAAETYKPQLEFRDFDGFMEFAYDGGWLTPFIEDLQLQKAHPVLRALLNAFVFPVVDHHTIVVGLARKPLEANH